MAYKNSPGQAFNWGVIARKITIAINGAAKPVKPVIQLPADGTFGTTGFSIVYLNVYLCPASDTPCAASGSANLRGKAQITGTTAPATVSVLSWNLQS